MRILIFSSNFQYDTLTEKLKPFKQWTKCAFCLFFVYFYSKLMIDQLYLAHNVSSFLMMEFRSKQKWDKFDFTPSLLYTYICKLAKNLFPYTESFKDYFDVIRSLVWPIITEKTLTIVSMEWTACSYFFFFL